MMIDLKPIYNNVISTINIRENLIYDEAYLRNSGIKEIDNIMVKGTISKNITEEIIINLQVTGKMVLTNSINLEDVIYPVDVTINENIEEFSKINEFYLDILDVVWQYIILEIPMKVITDSPNTNLSGEGWQLLSEDELKQKTDSRLDNLKDLLKERS